MPRVRRFSGGAPITPINMLSTSGKHPDELALPAPPPLVESCCICLSTFRPGRPGVVLPCTRRCSREPNVHLRCIYEWQLLATEGNNTCPLCRAPLERVEYQPPDLLASHTLFMTSARRTFCSRPAHKGAGMIRCFIQVVATGWLTSTPIRYEMYLQAPFARSYPGGVQNDGNGPAPGDIFLMSAKRITTRKGVSEIHISLDKRTISRKSPYYLGRVKGNLLGLDYTISVPYRFDGLTPLGGATRYVELGSLHFTQNRIGAFAGPRRINLCLPQVREEQAGLVHKEENDDDEDDEDTQYLTAAHDPRSRNDSLRRVLRQGPTSDQRFIFAHNVQPYFLESLQAYSLDFSGRVTLPSNKNFIMSLDSDPNSKCLVFGKVSKAGDNGAQHTAYTLDFEWPLSPVQAFGIALASADRKFGCA